MRGRYVLRSDKQKITDRNNGLAMMRAAVKATEDGSYHCEKILEAQLFATVFSTGLISRVLTSLGLFSRTSL